MYESGVAGGRTVTLEQLILKLSDAGVFVGTDPTSQDIVIDHLTLDSRAVGPGGLFIAIRGEQADGHLFIDKAVDNGAIAIVYEATPGEPHLRLPGVALVPVTDSRRAAGLLAACYFRANAGGLRTIGVTGTNGKTTTAWLSYQVLNKLDPPSGLIGTIEYRTPLQDIVASHTTPDALQLHALLDTMRNEGGRSCAMEVSSHALVQSRVEGVRFDVAVFTNLTQDHLDYHGTMASYRDAKKMLFDRLDRDAVAVYNADDDSGSSIVADTAARRLSYGSNTSADVQFSVVENRMNGLTLSVDGSIRRFDLVGRFNAYNLAAAYASVRALGHGRDESLDALEEALGAPGRFEAVHLEGGPTAIVDYAHTPDALQNVLNTVAELTGRESAGESENASNIWCVFGCGGDRDRGKRPIMGRIAEEGADHVVVTDDNPRTESSLEIFADIRKGFRTPDRATWLSDRAAAIEAALTGALSDDVVVVAGKGHETYQVLGNQRVDFDDREVIRRTWHRLQSGTGKPDTRKTET